MALGNNSEHNDNNSIKVMIVDDSATIRRTADMLLQQAGYTVITAEDGFAALPKIVNEHPNIIFLDIMMPRLDGYQACSIIKNNPVFSHIPIIMLSSKDGIFDRAKGRLVGSAQFVSKPFTREDLLDAIQQNID